MSSVDHFEDAEIEGLSRGSWFGSCLRGVLVGAVLFIVGVIALSLSNPLPEHLPGVGKVEIVRNDNAATPAPKETPAVQPSEDASQASAPAQGGETPEQVAASEPAEPQPATPEIADSQPKPTPDDEDNNREQAGIAEDQASVTAPAPAQPEAPSAPQPEDAAAPTIPEQQVAAQPVQPVADVDDALTDGGVNDNLSEPTQPDQTAQDEAQPEITEDPAQPEVSQLEATDENTDQEVAALTPEQTEQPLPQIDLPGPAMDVNARAFDSPEGAALLAVVLQDADGTTIATDALPLMTMPLTFAIPSGAGNRSFAEQARAAGHEVLVQLPMATEEDSLTSALAKGQDATSLSAESVRHMAELDMAIGATAPHEAPLLRDQDGMSAVMNPLAPHGFLWLDPRQGIGSAAKGVADLQDMTWGAGDRYVDDAADADQIYQNLESAAAVARRNGNSIVFINASSEALKALVRWGLNRGGKEVWFAPVSAVVKARQAR